MLDSEVIRKNFPIFKHQPDLAYLDSAATSLKPQTVIDAERKYLEYYSTNIGRGLYPLAENVTEAYESAREKTARFLCAEAREIIFTSGTTDSINLVAALIRSALQLNSVILTTTLEHHSNFLPWKELSKISGSTCSIAPMSKDGCIDMEKLIDLVDTQTALVAFSAASNVTGAITPVTDIVRRIRAKNSKTIILVDAAQTIAHIPIDAASWDADFIAFSTHKAFGPTGLGILYGKASLLEKFAPVRFGGGMVLDAVADTVEYKDIPYRFEAGTPNISGVLAWSAALDYIESIGLKNIHDHETILVSYAIQELRKAFGDAICIIGPTDPKNRSGIISFSFKDIHPHDIAHLLGEVGICVRAGEHCAAPLHRALGLVATTRLSLSIYNTKEDIDRLIKRLKEINKLISNS